MSRAVLYVAHCLAPTEEEISDIPYETIERGRSEYEPDIAHPVSEVDRVKAALKLNLQRAMRWLAWLRKSFPETTFIAPWIASVLAGDDDADPSQREAGFVDACATIERCDGIVLCGPRISSGMDREMRHGTHRVMGGSEWFSLAPSIGQIPEFLVYDMTGDRAYMPSDVELRTDQTWAEWAKALRV
jgi:hypothetical protein